MNASLYAPLFLYSVVILTIIASVKLSEKTYRQISDSGNTMFFSAVLSLIMAVWLGMRPMSGAYFGDTPNYARIYEIVKDMPPWNPDADMNEWIWLRIMYVCSRFMDVSGFFTVVSIGYFGFTLFACRVLCKKNVYLALLFNLASFSFYSYGTNGIRNGLACSIVLLCISCMCKSGLRNKIFGLVLAFVAMNIHKSTMLPLLMLFLSLTCIRNFKWAYTFWIMSILISLVAGGPISSFFAGLGFDDRLSYISAEIQDGQFSHTGFRWDFLIYSMMPIVLGYYVVIRRRINDKTYMILLNTYTLSNAFWVMVIRANFSNRFAYLSWFMYAIVLAYPCLKLNVWGKKQGSVTARIMLSQIAFKWFMTVVYG